MERVNTMILGGTHGLGFEIARILVEKDQLGGIELVGRRYPVDKNQIKGLTWFSALDLSNPQSVEMFLGDHQNASNYKRFYWVAGTMLKGDFDKHSNEDVKQTVDVNIASSIQVVRQIWRQMQLHGGESFTIIASSSGLKPRDDEAVYSATKAFQVQLARSLGLESRRVSGERGTRPLKVSLFMPGGMKTGLWDSYPEVELNSFLDPSRVAKVIVEDVFDQADVYFEREIPRGSL